MIFTETKLKGAFIIESERHEDERGFFTRIWDKEEFERVGLDSKLVQCSYSFSKNTKTLRGMHYQDEPYGETKLIWCPKGSIYDVIVDLRPKSKTFRQWSSHKLKGNENRMLYVPKGFAHGFLTLESDTIVYYQMSEMYRPEYSRGVLWNDPAFQIKWPSNPSIISKRDASFIPFKNMC